MFPKEIRLNPRWCLYDALHGRTVLKHPFRLGLRIPCPQCQQPLQVSQHKASCCGYNFKTNFGEIHQTEPVGAHNRKSGRGWESLRPYAGES
jgi:hypothetical protein